MNHSERHRKLNLNAPIMSTRRFGSVFADTSSSSLGGTYQSTSKRVPFSWEKEPGKPKDTEKNGSKLPPCHHFFPRKEAANQSDVDNNGYDVMDDLENNDDLFSDAMDDDVFSLSEALDIVQRKSDKVHCDNNDGLKLKLAECSGYQSPTYLINRFLPDATALAASSALNIHSDFEENICNTCSYPECYLSESGRHSHSYAYASGSSSTSPKGCGLEVLFPWRNMKHKLCAIESPVLPCSATTNLQKHQSNSREAKPKKHQSSVYIPCTNVKKDV